MLNQNSLKTPNNRDIDNTTIIVIVCCSIIGASGLMILPLWIAAVVNSYGMDETHVGILATLQLSFGTCASFLVSSNLKKLNTKAIAIFGVILIFLANSVSSFVFSELILISTRIISGIGEGLLLAALNAIIARSNTSDRLFSISQTSIGISGILFFIVIPIFVANHGAAGIFGFISAISIIFLPVLIHWSIKVESDTETRNVTTAKVVNVNDHQYKTTAGKIMLTALLLVFLGAQGIWAYLGLIGSNIGFSNKEIGNILAFGAIVSLLGPYLSQKALANFNRCLPLCFSLVVLILSYWLMTNTNSKLLFFLANIPKQFIALFMATLIMGYLADLDPQGGMAAAAPACMNIGTAFSPTIASICFYYGGIQLIGWASILLIAIAIMLIVKANLMLQKYKIMMTS